MRPHQGNNIGILRLCFAALVIIGHAPEMVDGDRSREPLTALFHTLSLGEVSVDAFFLLSGYLITKSMVRTGRLLPFLERRVLRIYPAFVVAYLLSVFVLGPMVGAKVWGSLPTTVARLVLLREPASYPDQFLGLNTYPDLNRSLWTISHEFQCYVVVAMLGILGFLRFRWAILTLSMLSLAVAVLATYPIIATPLSHLDDSLIIRSVFGRTRDIVRLLPVFMVGACWFLFEAEMRAYVSAGLAFVCALLGCGLMYHNLHFAELGLVLFGGATLYWIAFKADIGVFQRINDRWDISYGTYLYGWPIAIYLVWRLPGASPWTVAAIALPLALLAGAASWWGLERWSKDFVRSKSEARVGRDEATEIPQRADQRRSEALLSRTR